MSKFGVPTDQDKVTANLRGVTSSGAIAAAEIKANQAAQPKANIKNAYDAVDIKNAILGGIKQADETLNTYQSRIGINTMATTYQGDTKTALNDLAGIAINAGFKSVLQDWETQKELAEAQKQQMIANILNTVTSAAFFLTPAKLGNLKLGRVTPMK